MHQYTYTREHKRMNIHRKKDTLHKLYQLRYRTIHYVTCIKMNSMYLCMSLSFVRIKHWRALVHVLHSFGLESGSASVYAKQRLILKAIGCLPNVMKLWKISHSPSYSEWICKYFGNNSNKIKNMLDFNYIQYEIDGKKIEFRALQTPCRTTGLLSLSVSLSKATREHTSK